MLARAPVIQNHNRHKNFYITIPSGRTKSYRQWTLGALCGKLRTLAFKVFRLPRRKSALKYLVSLFAILNILWYFTSIHTNFKASKLFKNHTPKERIMIGSKL